MSGIDPLCEFDHPTRAPRTTVTLPMAAHISGLNGYTYDANGNPTNRAGKTTQIGTWNRLLDDGDFSINMMPRDEQQAARAKTTGQTESYV